MRFLVDENLPRRLARWLRDRGEDAEHDAEAIGYGASDPAIWEHARRTAAVVVTRNNDFLALAARTEAGSVVRLRIGNCSVAQLFARLEDEWLHIRARIESGERAIENDGP